MITVLELGSEGGEGEVHARKDPPPHVERLAIFKKTCMVRLFDELVWRYRAYIQFLLMQRGLVTYLYKRGLVTYLYKK